jgi:predicted transposase YbfD/YdcC
MVIRRIATFLGRRGNKPSATTRKSGRPPAPNAAPIVPQRAGPPLIIWESELRAIAVETAAWTIETGGDLFGRWQGTPIVFLATKAGPNAQRSNAHFRLDVDYLRQLSEPLAEDWALRYFGDWHSHHRLGLLEPSSGDRRRIRQLGQRNQFPGMVEIIVTTEGAENEPTVRIHPWFYDLSSEEGPVAMNVTVLAGCSPIRQALLTRSAFPEQELKAWEQVPLDRLRIGRDANSPTTDMVPEVDATTRDRTLAHLAKALTKASGEQIEQHKTAFGQILVAKLVQQQHLAFAIDAKWPMSVLEVHQINRADGTTEVLSMPDGLLASDIAGVISTFHARKLRLGA